MMIERKMLLVEIKKRARNKRHTSVAQFIFGEDW